MAADGGFGPGVHASVAASASGGGPTSIRSPGDVALFIDWENLRIALREQYKATPNISSLIAAARDVGRLVFARAYADWTQPVLAIDAPNLYRAGIEPVYAQARRQHDGTLLKNSADVRLAVDVVASCTQLPHVDTYLLVTGDGDLVHPLNFVRLQGHRVLVVGVSGTVSAQLTASADRVLLYDRDIEPLTKPLPSAIEPPMTMDEAMTRLRAWLPLVLNGRTPRLDFPELQTTLLQRFGFNPRSYGLTFKEMMLAAREAAMIEIATEGSMDYAQLAGTSVSSDDAEDFHDLPLDRPRTGKRSVDLSSAAEPEALPGHHRPAPVSARLGTDDTVRLEALPRDVQVQLVDFVDDLEQSSKFLTVTFLVDQLRRENVVPMLSDWQLKSLLLRMIQDGLFTVSERPARSPATGEIFQRRELTLRVDHPTIEALLVDAELAERAT